MNRGQLWPIARLTGGLFLGLLCFPVEGYSYIGPDAGIPAFWALLPLLGGFLVVFLGIVLWPVKMLIRWLRFLRAKKFDESPAKQNKRSF